MLSKILAIIISALCLVGCANSGVKSTAIHRAALLNVEMGQQYMQQGQMDLGKQKLVHALELQPKLPEAHSAIAYLYESVGDLVEAELHHTQAIHYGVNKAAFYNNYGTFLCRQGRFEEAERAYLKALHDKKYIRTSQVYQNIAICEELKNHE